MLPAKVPHAGGPRIRKAASNRRIKTRMTDVLLYDKAGSRLKLATSISSFRRRSVCRKAPCHSVSCASDDADMGCRRHVYGRMNNFC